MTDKERLVELLDEITKVFRFDAWENTDKIANHLIANNVVVQKQGEWVGVERKPHMIYECSLCKEKWGYGAMLHMNYCPNCGTKMVKEDK